jgi:hypothetical protein
MLKNAIGDESQGARRLEQLGRWVGVMLLICWLAASLCAQVAAPAGASAPASTSETVLITSGSAAFQPLVAPPAADLFREIDDPSSGTRWLLFRDPIHPGGPGRLVPLGPWPLALGPSSSVPGPWRLALRPVIHSGDRIVVEQNTPVIEARFEAIALGPAVPGATLQARLRIGGRVVRAVALAPHRAALVPETEPRP